MTRLLPITFFLFLIISGCKQQDITPSFLTINNFILNTDEPSQGSNSQGITDAWLYMDNKPLGVFEVPATIPILAEGNHEFIIIPGVKQNGISATRVQYPFYNTVVFEQNLIKNDTVAITPVTTYKSSTEFAFIEDFESAGFQIVKSESADTNIIFVTDPTIVKYGDKCGGIFLGPSDSLYAGSTNEYLNLPKGQEVYLEIDFRNDNSMLMGLLYETFGVQSQDDPLIQMNPQTTGTEVWKKMYINLKDNVSAQISASNYDIYFLSILDKGKTTSSFYIDNIKVVHF
jgi:hypothetical protein